MFFKTSAALFPRLSFPHSFFLSFLSGLSFSLPLPNNLCSFAPMQASRSTLILSVCRRRRCHIPFGRLKQVQLQSGGGSVKACENISLRKQAATRHTRGQKETGRVSVPQLRRSDPRACQPLYAAAVLGNSSLASFYLLIPTPSSELRRLGVHDVSQDGPHPAGGCGRQCHDSSSYTRTSMAPSPDACLPHLPSQPFRSTVRRPGRLAPLPSSF